VTAARWDGERVSLAARGAPVPFLLRFGRPVPFEVRESGGVAEVSVETAGRDLVVLASQGLFALASAGKPASAELAVQRLARACETQSLAAGFAGLVSEWKKTGIAPGPRDVLLLAARRLPPG
jgi:hypothetical protein